VILNKDHLIVLMSLRTCVSVDQTGEVQKPFDRVKELAREGYVKGTGYGWGLTQKGRNALDGYRWDVVKEKVVSTQDYNFNRAKVQRVREIVDGALQYDDAGDWFTALQQIKEVVGGE